MWTSFSFLRMNITWGDVNNDDENYDYNDDNDDTDGVEDDDGEWR